MLAIILPGEPWAQFREGIPTIFPRVSPDTERRGKKRIVTKLVETDFSSHNRQACAITQPLRQGAIHQVNEKAIERPEGCVKNKVAHILQPNASALKKYDNEQLG